MGLDAPKSGGDGEHPETTDAVQDYAKAILADRIATDLGHPSHDPHGDPIPTVDGRIDDVETRSLADLETGDVGLLARVSDSDPEMLRYLADRGIGIGMKVAVRDREPFEGPLTVLLDQREHVLGRAVAQAIRVDTSPR